MSIDDDLKALSGLRDGHLGPGSVSPSELVLSACRAFVGLVWPMRGLRWVSVQSDGVVVLEWDGGLAEFRSSGEILLEHVEVTHVVPLGDVPRAAGWYLAYCMDSLHESERAILENPELYRETCQGFADFEAGRGISSDWLFTDD